MKLTVLNLKSVICIVFSLACVFAQSPTAQAPQLKPPAEAQAKFRQTLERVKNAQISVELARREMDAANEQSRAVLNEIRAENAWPESKFDASLDKDGTLVFTAKPVTAKK
jgi:hypothetical protein